MRQFQELRYQTRDTWSCDRVVANVEHLPRGKNPRFIVTSVPVQERWAQIVEEVYCARGDGESDQQMGLFAERTSTLAGNQLHRETGGTGRDELARAQNPAGEIAEDRGTESPAARSGWSYPYAALLRTALTQVALPLRC